MVLKPKPFQAPIVDSICNALNASNRALIVMATGTGKTLTAAFAVERQIGTPSREKRVLVLAHVNAILEQLEGEFRKLFPRAQVGRLYSGSSVGDADAIIFANFATMRSCIQRGEFTPVDFEMVIVDEGHHAQADIYRDVIMFFKPQGLIGMTATPDRMDGKDIRQIFGEPVATVTLAEAMTRGYVTPVTYKLMSVDGLTEEIAAIRHELEAGGAKISKQYLETRLFREAADQGFLTLMDELPPEAKVIIFADSISRADNLEGRVASAKAYHSDIDPTKRGPLLDRFRRGEIRRLLTVDALNEGVDVPDADVIIFLRCTESLTIFLQQLGRGLRLAPGKECVTVYDFVGNVRRLQMLRNFLEEMKVKRKEIESDGDRHDQGSAHSDVPDDGDILLSDRIDPDSISIEFAPELIDILRLLDGMEKDFYPTLAEASEAARKLGIKSRDEYRGIKGQVGAYKKDPRLHSTPGMFYPDWEDWPTFLGTKPYATLAEASEAAKKLGIKSGTEYQGAVGREGRYKEDPKLHSSPSRFYPDWEDWPTFLGTTKPYATLAEASEAAKKLGIKSSAEYLGHEGFVRRHREDPKLHYTPNKFYPDWEDWPTFLGTKPYATLAEASEAAKKLGIKSGTEYKGKKGQEAAYKKDPRLHSNPDKFYPDWAGWPMFLGTAKAP